MGKQEKGFSRRDFLIQGTASLGAMATAPAWAQHAAEDRPGNKKVIHIIGYSHIDAAWLWPWREGSDIVLTTFRSALDRMNETPGFRYSHSSSAHYRWVEKRRSADVRRDSAANSRRPLGGGRRMAGGAGLQHSLHGKLCSPLALRQALLPVHLGVDVKIGFNPDSFGHAAGLPTILKSAGYEYYVFMRPPEHEMNLPLLFWWEGADGSRVLTLRIWHTYDAGAATDSARSHRSFCARL